MYMYSSVLKISPSWWRWYVSSGVPSSAASSSDDCSNVTTVANCCPHSSANRTLLGRVFFGSGAGKASEMLSSAFSSEIFCFADEVAEIFLCTTGVRRRC
ncbi:Protein PRRC2A [Trichinella spiralis]|uniref:Protein PRRC2A n=1 Tax=Trichinella spiralis TaxID=6334 RepID=A0ABR3KVE3_TRISP